MIKTQDSPDVPGFRSVTVTGDAEGHLVTTYDPPESAPDLPVLTFERPMVTRAVRQQRRAKNKAGRVSRRINRKRGA